jgi:hypothetical protein
MVALISMCSEVSGFRGRAVISRLLFDGFGVTKGMFIVCGDGDRVAKSGLFGDPLYRISDRDYLQAAARHLQLSLPGKQTGEEPHTESPGGFIPSFREWE